MNMGHLAKNKVVGRLNRLVRRILERSGLAPGKLLIVAVSGGPDSLALLWALNQLRDDLRLRLHGAHLNHRIRGLASEADAKFVARAFERLRIPFTLDEVDVPAIHRRDGLSLEETARRVRRNFLARVTREQHGDGIALGHTADDQAETVLMHIIRGSGLTGLRGMAATTLWTFDGSEVALVRPLLQASRQETADYCRAQGLEPRLDESNLSTKMRRNWVRKTVLPLLEKANPAVRDALIRLARSTSRDIDYIERQVDEAWQQIANHDAISVTLNRSAFSQLAPAIQSHLLRRAVFTVNGNLDDLEQNHIDSMAQLMTGPSGRTLDLPHRIRFSVSYSRATLTSSELDLCPLPSLEGEQALAVPGETLLPGWHVTTQFVDPKASAEEHPNFSRAESISTHAAYVTYDSLDGVLLVRARRPGDRFQPAGMTTSKKLQDFMVDSKIPRHWRDRVPLVVSSKGIIWVVGWRIAEWATAVHRDTEQLAIRFVAQSRREVHGIR